MDNSLRRKKQETMQYERFEQFEEYQRDEPIRILK